tara:strand:+ start:2843 stop:3346 length:504 start_codon:yes stop_codon:yes gene_type:complete
MKYISVLENKGYIIFTKKEKYTEIKINLSNLPKNKKLGLHIHEYGDMRSNYLSKKNGGDFGVPIKCCSSAGVHYNPYKKEHGNLNSKESHLGDLGNIITNKNGLCKCILKAKKIKLNTKYDILGRMLILHDNEDDLGLKNNKKSKLTGNSGNRLVCGIIGLMNKNYK